MSPPPLRFTIDSCSHQKPADIKPTSSLHISSDQSWTKGIPSAIFPFLVYHWLWVPSRTPSGIEHWVLGSFSFKSHFTVDVPHPSGLALALGALIPSITQESSCILSEDHNLYLVTSCLCRLLMSYPDTLSADDRSDNSAWMCLKD